MTLPQKNGSRIKTPSSKLLILVSFSWKNNFLRISTLTTLIWFLIPFKLVIIGVAFWATLYSAKRTYAIMWFFIKNCMHTLCNARLVGSGRFLL